MKFSVIIPSYNQKNFLPEAIESARAQTVPCEIIVIDDGSTDGSLEIARNYKDIKVISQVNKGLPSARNTGIMNATGDYILPLDADDILLETCVEKMTKAAEESHSDVIVPSFKVFGIYNVENILNGIPTLQDILIANRFPYFSAIRRDLLLEIGGYNPRMVWGWEDYDLWIDIFKRGKSLTVLQEVLVLYRTKEKSMYLDSLLHQKELREQMMKNHPSLPW